MILQYIIMYNGVWPGMFEFVGPFNSYTDAHNYATLFLKTKPYSIVPLNRPHGPIVQGMEHAP